MEIPALAASAGFSRGIYMQVSRRPGRVRLGLYVIYSTTSREYAVTWLNFSEETSMNFAASRLYIRTRTFD